MLTSFSWDNNRTELVIKSTTRISGCVRSRCLPLFLEITTGLSWLSKAPQEWVVCRLSMLFFFLEITTGLSWLSKAPQESVVVYASPCLPLFLEITTGLSWLSKAPQEWVVCRLSMLFFFLEITTGLSWLSKAPQESVVVYPLHAYPFFLR